MILLPNKEQQCHANVGMCLASEWICWQTKHLFCFEMIDVVPLLPWCIPLCFSLSLVNYYYKGKA
jgi:hypothetical protein